MRLRNMLDGEGEAVAEWRPIPGCPGYEASNDGRVRRVTVLVLERHHETQRSTLRVTHADGRRRRHLVSRLVCAAFHGEPPDEGMHASHLNGDEHDNRPENLRWETPKENEARKPGHAAERAGQQPIPDGEPSGLS